MIALPKLHDCIPVLHNFKKVLRDVVLSRFQSNVQKFGFITINTKEMCFCVILENLFANFSVCRGNHLVLNWSAKGHTNKLLLPNPHALKCY
jgi:hypothetical protein